MIRGTGGPVIALAALVASGTCASAQTDAVAVDTTYQAMLASAPVAKALSDMHVLLTALALVGVEGVSKPLLAVRPTR